MRGARVFHTRSAERDVYATSSQRQTHLALKTLCGHSDLISSVAFSPDGTRLAALDARRYVKVWQAHTGEESASPESRVGAAYSLTFSPDSQWLAIGSTSGQAWLWKIGTPTVEILGGPNVMLKQFVFSPDGRSLIGDSFGNLILFWDVGSRKLLMRVPHYKPGVSFVRLSPDGKLLALPTKSRGREWELELWRFPTLEEIDAVAPWSGAKP